MNDLWPQVIRTSGRRTPPLAVYAAHAEYAEGAHATHIPR